MSRFSRINELSGLSIQIIKQEGLRYFLGKVFKKIRTGEFKLMPVGRVSFANTDDEELALLEKNIAWIMGSPRSGSTWLTQLLDKKGIYIWNEPDIAINLEPINNRNQDVLFKTRDTYFFSDYYKKGWMSSLRHLILTRTLLQVKTIENKVIIKEPVSFAADLIMETLPNSKLIFLLRDGRDVVDSFIDAHSKGSWEPSRQPLLNEQRRLEKIKQYSNLWVKLTRSVWSAYQRHDPGLRLLIKYEDILSEPLSHLEKIHEFLEMPADPGELENVIAKYDFKKIPVNKTGSGKFTRAATPGSWKNNFSAAEQNTMHEIMTDALRQRGYEI